MVETGRSNSTLYYKGKVSHGPRRETAVYAKVNGKWIQASLHVGFIPSEQKDFISLTEHYLSEFGERLSNLCLWPCRPASARVT